MHRWIPQSRISYEPGDHRPSATCGYRKTGFPVGADKPGVLAVLVLSSHSRFIIAECFRPG
jgi:hypothetical protein